MLKKNSFLITVLMFISGLFLSCTRNLGYSVLLWSNPEHELFDGTLLKVHIKSNISQVYVVSIPGSKENFEIPLWQATEPESKGKALRQQKRFSEFEHTYASVKLDGLPIRSDAVNTSKQVYRLREGEIIRCLYKGEGAAVTNGKGNMKGEWLRVLTETGTYGWCFSHNLELFYSENYDVKSVKESAVKMNDLKGENKNGDNAIIESLVTKKWYPESFQNMIKVGRIDVNRMNPDYGFSFGINIDENADSVFAGTAVLNTENAAGSWTFTDIKKTAEKEYEFTGANLKMSIRGATSDTMILQYSEKGRPKVETLVALSEDIEELISNELMRRQDELKRIAQAGPVFKSSNYGTIKFNNENSVTWSNYKLLQPAIISNKALGSVTVTLDYFIANSLKSSYDGVLTMHFTGMEDGVNFLYKLTDTGLRLEDATHAPIKDGVVTSRSASPMILFFAK
ncbi:SH3 domain-containing protein [Treponema sp.]|uniref:SH3 domain-containing protein n=1 Tax=Treponema sp. TaxID=166 RepID=UPI00388EB298